MGPKPKFYNTSKIKKFDYKEEIQENQEDESDSDIDKDS